MTFTSPTKAWVRIVGPILALLLLWKVDLQAVEAALARVDLVPFAASLLLALPLFALKAWRWRRLLSTCGHELGEGRAFVLYVFSAGLAAVTPGAVGDFWKGLARDAGGRAAGLWTSAVDRAIDVLVLGALGAVCAILSLDSTPARAILVTSLAGAAVLAFTYQVSLIAQLTRRFPKLPILPEMHPVPADAFLLTIAATGVAWVRFTLLVDALGLDLTAYEDVLAYALSSTVAALPLSIAGLGTRDLSLVAWLQMKGIVASDAVALSTLCLALTLWNAVLALILWAFVGESRREEEAESAS